MATARHTGALTAAKFCHILDTVVGPYTSGVFPNGDFLSQQDLTPVHTARSVQARLQQTGIEQLAWVPKGADINVIENAWGRMKVALNRTPMPSATEDELRVAVLAEWQRLASDTSLVTALNESRPSRISAVVEVNGDMTH
ncbi:hypothetical protein HPB48_018487 [Haemaphysalis longicornis]|uniref:Tc1-like transposase DDE domain-containing protein n=1 Tax=Haemaphysalis longicornis TaxID=44386 RepID=A0A9J6FSA7_HAELO|nr:hypothetical protein HPB48_018487 [Haemaphysalis longicornis]